VIRISRISVVSSIRQGALEESKGASILARAEHPQNPYVAGGLAAVGVGMEFVQGAVTAVTG
jgi:hypothetical protein